MRNKKHYITLGIFVIFSTIAMIIIALWLSVGISKDTYYTYTTIFHEPVDGLSVNSNVLYNGVNVGKVASIKLNQENPGDIYVSLQIISGTPITKQTFATLQQQGITGLSYIGLQTPKEAIHQHAELLEPKLKPPYPIIPSKLSFISNLTDKFEQVSGNLNEISKRVNQLLDDKNSQYISNILKNTDELSKSLIQSSTEATKLIQSATNITTSFEKNNQKVDQIIDQINTSTQALNALIKQFDHVAKTVGEQTLPNLNDVLIPQINNTLNSIQSTANSLNQLVQKVDQNPAMLIKGQVPVQPGPGE